MCQWLGWMVTVIYCVFFLTLVSAYAFAFIFGK